MTQLRKIVSWKRVRTGSVLPALVSGLTLVGLWLNQQFEVGRGPLRSVDPRIVIWATLAAISILLLLWVSAALAPEPGPTGEDC